MRSLSIATKNEVEVGYQIGHTIGSYLPFIIIVLIAVFIYLRAKKRNRNT